MNNLRDEAQDFFIPIGTHDLSTPARKDISNLSKTLENHVPLVEEFVKAAAPYPVYVGYDGNDIPGRAGSYYNNLVLLHQDADDSSQKFILAYVHELTHMHQDRMGLLRMDEVPPAAQLVDFLAHNLMLEAAALATEVSVIYYLAHHSRLKDDFDEIAELYDEYVSMNAGRDKLHGTVIYAAQKAKIKDFEDMKPVWKTVFQQFFAPDSPFMDNYVRDFCEKYMHRLESEAKTSRRKWGRNEELTAITTMPGWGPLFGEEAVDILQTTIRNSLLQEKHLPLIDLTRNVAMRREGQSNILQALIQLK